jgi:hypothetical protein
MYGLEDLFTKFPSHRILYVHYGNLCTCPHELQWLSLVYLLSPLITTVGHFHPGNLDIATRDYPVLKNFRYLAAAHMVAADPVRLLCNIPTGETLPSSHEEPPASFSITVPPTKSRV